VVERRQCLVLLLPCFGIPKWTENVKRMRPLVYGMVVSTTPTEARGERGVPQKTAALAGSIGLAVFDHWKHQRAVISETFESIKGRTSV
jgi:hypothetical protein